MSSPTDEAAEISAQILRAIQHQLADVLHDQLLAAGTLVKPTLHLEGVIHEGWEGAADARPVSRRIHLGSIDIAAIRAASATPQTPASTTTAAETPGNNGGTLALSRPQRARRPPPRDYLSDPEPASKRCRKETGGLRLSRPSNHLSPTNAGAANPGRLDDIDEMTDQPAPVRQIEPETKKFPQRKKVAPKVRPLQPSTLDRLIIGIWEQIHGSISFDPQIIDQWKEPRAQKSIDSVSAASHMELYPARGKSTSFNRMNVLCRKVTTASRCCRSLEVIVQAYWIQCFEARVHALCEANPHQSVTKCRKAALMEACHDFGWSEKDLRNKMAIWRGYHEIKEAAGWVALVFAGMGIYRFCKYRISFDKEAMQRLATLRSRFEVAADTLQPQWRQLLSFIGESSERTFHGHPHDWVVEENGMPVPLASTYSHWDPNFSYEHIDFSILDVEAWNHTDPRELSSDKPQQYFTCASCRELQSDDPAVNSCRCFPSLYGGPRNPCPVQVFRTLNGRNNGLVACCIKPFERGTAIGEFVGLVTRGLHNMDVMQGETNGKAYQIWQGRQGNYTRFVNHSCHPNSQFEKFTWLGVQRIILVSKGIGAGQEITVDYSGKYWTNLDKECLCGESCCRYRNRGHGRVDTKSHD
ncbi:set domain-containing protein [Diplodia corticola]|uniref:Set domain-containing protein n=1 Tax=Diplodia corticola TaxID=236234 RepID=A0A1J9QYN8_9PEZI|nr:set domain-containing protein [Diplodia corticola]OJD33497.1 set domain-containing protein [Diplodia corticola]